MYNKGVSSIFTQDAELLTTPDKTYKWGMVNDKPVSFISYSCTFNPESKYKYLKASIYLDDNRKNPLKIDFTKNEFGGEVIKAVTINPGETYELNLEITGINKVCVSTGIVQSDKISKLIIGEPQFSNK